MSQHPDTRPTPDQPARSSTPAGPALDVQAQLSSLQEQLDDLRAVVEAQQDTIDRLTTAAGNGAPSAPRPATPRSPAPGRS